MKYGQTRFIDWDALGEIGLVEDVHKFVEVGGWERILSIRDPTHRDITLEVLASFSFDCSYTDFDRENTIRF